MSDTFTPIIVSSKKARKDFERIKQHATEIIQHHKDHVARVQQYNEVKKTEQMEKMQRANEERKVMEERASKEREFQMNHQKEMMAHNVKLKELEIKKQALSNG